MINTFYDFFQLIFDPNYYNALFTYLREDTNALLLYIKDAMFFILLL